MTNQRCTHPVFGAAVGIMQADTIAGCIQCKVEQQGAEIERLERENERLRAFVRSIGQWPVAKWMADAATTALQGTSAEPGTALGRLQRAESLLREVVQSDLDFEAASAELLRADIEMFIEKPANWRTLKQSEPDSPKEPPKPGMRCQEKYRGKQCCKPDGHEGEHIATGASANMKW